MRIFFFTAFLVSVFATLGSLYISEIASYIPCKLCWFQRILMYPLTLILFFQTVRKEYKLSPAIIFSTSGLLLSLYHYLLQHELIGDSQAACSTINCGIKYINYLGFITIPFLSLVAFTMITILLFFSKKSNSKRHF